MPSEKTVHQRSQCVFSNALDLFGDKWTLLVVRDLFFFNKHEYKEFLSSPEAIATNILSDRLKKLYAAGIIDEKIHPENRSRKLYYLTTKGKDLLPIFLELAKWGAKYMKDLPAMQSLYRKLGSDEKGLKAQVIADIQKWEAENLG